MARFALLFAAAALLLSGCGSDTRDDRAAPAVAARARAAVERGLLGSVRTAPGAGSVGAVHCAGSDGSGRRFVCRLDGARPQRVTVTVAGDGWWTARGVHAAAAPQMSATGADPAEAARGTSLTGCCVPLR